MLKNAKKQTKSLNSRKKLQKESLNSSGQQFLQEDLERQNKENRHAVAIEKLKNSGAEGYCQYKVISLVDENGGYINANQLTANLNVLGIEGWHLVAAYSNEIGHNSSSSGLGGFSSGTNSTVDQNILIFERFVRF